MFKFIIQKIYNEEGEDARSKGGIITNIIGLLLNLILSVIKFLAGYMSGSISITADAMNNLSDSASSVLSLIGFYYAGKPADKEHPYGHERSEYISGLFVSLIIIIVGYQFLISSLSRILNPTANEFSLLVLTILLISIIVKFFLGIFYRQASHYINSITLKATAQDSFNDAIATSIILVSSLVEHYTGWHVDGYVGLLVAIYILLSGIKLILEAMNDLLGTRPDKSLVEDIQVILNTYERIIGYHDLLVHDYGPNKIFASIHIEIDDTWSLNDAHQVINRIEEEIKNKLEIELVCHLDPVAVQNDRINQLYRQVKAVLKSFKLELKFHDFQVEEINGERILHFDVVFPEDMEITENELESQIKERIYQTMGEFQINMTLERIYLLEET